MRLTVRITDLGLAGTFLCLCDEHGNPLPGQVETQLVQDIEGPAVFTASFVVDGEDVSLASGGKC